MPTINKVDEERKCADCGQISELFEIVFTDGKKIYVCKDALFSMKAQIEELFQ